MAPSSVAAAGPVAAHSLSALSGLEILEMRGAASTALGSIAVSFAGMIAAKLGATVHRLERADDTSGTAWPPLMPDGSSALFRFLNASKKTVPASFQASAGSYLLTDDAAIADAWGDERRVLVRPSSEPESRWQSELTAMAASGLLDIVGEPGRAPLPLPGNQMAYAAGLAALTALLAAHHADLAHQTALRAETAVVDVATWLNWKNRLPSVSGNRQTGRERREEWLAVPCRDGYIALIFRDRDIPDVAQLAGSQRLLADVFKKESTRLEHLEEFHRIVSEALAGRGKDDILRQAGELGLQFSAVLAPGEVFEDPQMAAREFFSFDGAARMPRLPILWTRAAPTRASAERT
jgi:crotonobetainyl-CoA:carnitine CoA-transferase CaiB-like acyl-CoA transferase